MGQGSFSCSRDSVWSASLHEIRIDHETLFNIIMIVVCFLWNNHKMATACKKSCLCKYVQPVAHSARRKGLRTADGPGPGTRWRCWQGVDTAPVVRFAQSVGARLAQCLQGCPLLVTGDCCSGADADVSCPQLQLGSTRSAQIIYNLHTTAAYIYFSTINCSDNCKLICRPNLKFLKIILLYLTCSVQ